MLAAVRGLERVLLVLRRDVELLTWLVFLTGAVFGVVTQNGLLRLINPWLYLGLWWGLTALAWAARWWVPAGLRWCAWFIRVDKIP